MQDLQEVGGIDGFSSWYGNIDIHRLQDAVLSPTHPIEFWLIGIWLYL